MTKTLGFWILGAAVAVGAYFLLVFDPSVEVSDGERIINLGLLSERQNWIVVCGVAALVGVLMLLFAPAGQQRTWRINRTAKILIGVAVFAVALFSNFFIYAWGFLVLYVLP